MSNLIAFRVSKREKEFVKKMANEYGFTQTEAMRFALHKVYINEKITVEQFKERLF